MGKQTKTSAEVKAKLEKSLGRVTQTCQVSGRNSQVQLSRKGVKISLRGGDSPKEDLENLRGDVLLEVRKP